MARGACKLVSVNGALTVTFTTASGATPVVFSDEACTTTVALPATVADGANTTFYFASPGAYTLSVKTSSGVQIAGDLGATRTISVTTGEVAVLTYDTRIVARDASGDSGRNAVNAALAGTYRQLLPVTASGDTTGAADKASINTALATARVTGGIVALIPGSTYYLNGPLVIGSHTTLDAIGSTIMLVTASSSQMIRTYPDANPAASASDAAITSGSNVVTTALGASAVVGQTVVITGACTGGVQALAGQVSAATSTTITITDYYGNAVNAGATVSGAAVKLYTRATDLSILGGIWDRQGNNGSTPTGFHSVVMRYADGVHLSGLSFKSTSGKYCISLAGCTNYVIERITGLSTWSDGVHIDGPSAFGTVRDIYGVYGDDMVAITPMDWFQFGDIAGDVTDLLIENIYPNGTTRAAVKILGGQQGAAKRITVKNVKGWLAASADSALWIGDDPGQPETAGGLIDQIRVEGLSTTTTATQALLRLNGLNMKRVHLDGAVLDNASSSRAFIEFAPASACTFDSLTLENVTVLNVGNGSAYANLSTASTINKLRIIGWDFRSQTGTQGIMLNGCTVTDLLVDGCTGYVQAPANGLGSLIYLLNGSTTTVTRATFDNCHLIGPAGNQAFIQAASTTHTLTYLSIANSIITGFAWLYALATTTDISLSNVTSLSPAQGVGFAYATGNLTIRGDGNNLAAGGANWNVNAGGKQAIRVIDAPPSTHAGCIPTIAAGAGAGTGPTVTVAGTDRAGSITITLGTTPAAGALCTVTFIGTWPQAPKVSLDPTTTGAAACVPYISAKSTTTFTVSCNNTPSGSITFDYLIAA